MTILFSDNTTPDFIKDIVTDYVNLYFSDIKSDIIKVGAFFQVDYNPNDLKHIKIRVGCTDEKIKNRVSIRLDETMPNLSSLN